jgi:hypothetical protein
VHLEQWCELDERAHTAEVDERYKQFAGLEYSAKLIEQSAEIKLIIARTFIDSFSERRELFLSSIDSIADSSTKKLELQLYSLRNKKIVSQGHKFGNMPVSWST